MERQSWSGEPWPGPVYYFVLFTATVNPMIQKQAKFEKIPPTRHISPSRQGHIKTSLPVVF